MYRTLPQSRVWQSSLSVLAALFMQRANASAKYGSSAVNPQFAAALAAFATNHVIDAVEGFLNVLHVVVSQLSFSSISPASPGFLL
jgi:hypothetical protein